MALLVINWDEETMLYIPFVEKCFWCPLQIWPVDGKKGYPVTH